ncbi:MAG: ATP-binding protein [Chloroflexaceae bacterium]|nr:ATP-binding protein [Chloroflexaceae bacterium]
MTEQQPRNRTTRLARLNPYVGPRAFQEGERLYGRDQEVFHLLNLLIAERIVLLYSPSGAGKTSLLRAELIPRLQAEDFFVYPIIRINTEPATAANRYVLSTMLSLEERLPANEHLPLEQVRQLSLSQYLDLRRGVPAESDAQVLIFDQFEEVLTIDPANQEARAAFFAQLGEALRDQHRWALFAMREDFIAGLDPYVRAVPTRFENTFRLDLLNVPSALLAIQRPAASMDVTVTDEAAHQLVDDLRRMVVQRPDGNSQEQPGPYVEPVQLQVVSYRLWENLPADDNVIDLADVQALGDVNQALGTYYAEQVAAIAAATGVPERRIRAWIGRNLVTPQGLRGQVLQGAQSSEGLPNAVIWQLVDAHLLRGEKRRGATWFELAHDRLIEPVTENNSAWFATNLNALQQQAIFWEQQQRPNNLLLDGPTLRQVEAAKIDAASLTDTERDFLDESRANRAQVLRERRQTRMIYGLAVITTIISIVAVLLWLQAQAAEAEAQQFEQTAASTVALLAVNVEQRATVDAVRATEDALKQAVIDSQGTALAANNAPEVQTALTRATELVGELEASRSESEAVQATEITGRREAELAEMARQTERAGGPPAETVFPRLLTAYPLPTITETPTPTSTPTDEVVVRPPEFLATPTLNATIQAVPYAPPPADDDSDDGGDDG